MAYMIQHADTYIQVEQKTRAGSGKLTYGGNQNFFQTQEHTSPDYLKYKMGCGAVALGDLLLYLASMKPDYQTIHTGLLQGRILTEEEYKTYYNLVYDLLGGTKEKTGISGLKIAKVFNMLAKTRHWNLRAKWGMNSTRLLWRTKQMLEQELPVILSIAPNLGRKNRQDALTVYQQQPTGEYKPVTSVSGHYVVITMVCTEATTGKIWFTVSSWGKRYEIDYKELMEYQKRHFLGNITGNILYLYHK